MQPLAGEAVSRLYAELRALAASCLQRERSGHTLQATALVHEAFLRLVDQRQIDWRNRAHVLALAAQSIRRILVDHARGKKSDKRGGRRLRLTLDENLSFLKDSQVDLLDLEEALKRLAELDERQCRVVELRFFGGLRVDEAAGVLGVSPRTVEDDWHMARAWLRRELSA